MAINAQTMLQSIYDSIFGALTGSVPGFTAPRMLPPSQSYLTILKNRIRIEPMAYANAWSPGNPNGSHTAALNLAELVAQAPALNPVWTPIGRVEDFYEEIVKAEVDSPPPNPAQEAAVRDAENFLFDDGVDFDPVTGAPIVVPNSVHSPVYTNYFNKFSNYEAALRSYLAEWDQVDQSSTQDKQKWAILAPILENKVRMAYAEFQTAKPGIIQEKESILGQAAQTSLVSRFQQARTIFERAVRADPENPLNTYRPVQVFPANWSTTQAYSSVLLKSSETHTSSSSSWGRWNAGGGLNFGLFSIGGGGGRSWSTQNFHQDTSDMTISFRFASVDIRRPWLRENLLTTTGWRVDGRAKNAYSTGKVEPQNTGVFPLLPVSFVVVRDVRVTANWSSADRQIISQQVNGGGGVRIGPFQFGGSGGSSSTSSSATFNHQSGELFTPEIEVIAFMNRLIPASPPK